MMQALKQLVGVLATPLVLALVGLLLGGLARAFGRRRLAIWLCVSAAALVYFLATPLMATALLAPLERSYPPLRVEPELEIRHVVVLGSYYAPRDGLPVTATLGADGLARIVEGVRLARMFPEAKLVVSGGSAPGHMPSALGYAQLAQELGIDSDRLAVIDSPRNTAEEAAAIARMLGSSTFVLVTSASHMPRAMQLMRSAGARPLAAPTAHRADRSGIWRWRALLPAASSLRGSELALHEYVGLFALSIGLQ
jgi:uncharacterized SAM-binding protein YcdF (DUF218 family)